MPRINDVVFNLTVEGTPWGPVNGIQSMTIFIKYVYAVPAVVIVVEDKENSVGSKYRLEDGARIEIEYGRGGNVRKDPFRIYKVERDISNSTAFYTISAWYDSVKWFVDGTTKSYKGSSSSVVQQLAQECGLDAQVDPTSDSQTWLGGGAKRYVFARKIAQRGRASDKSLMLLGCQPGLLLYKDINALDYAAPKARFVIGGDPAGGNPPTYGVTSHKLIVPSGVRNLAVGYKEKTLDQNIYESKDNPMYEAVEVKLRGSRPAMNQDIASQVKTPVLQTGLVKSRNTYEEYNLAKHQNARGIAIATNCGMEMVTPWGTQINLFDPIEVIIPAGALGASTNRTARDPNAGPYFVLGRIISFQGANYAEKLLAYREGYME